MIKRKNLLAASLAMMMAIGTTACGSSDSGSNNSEYDQVTYAYCTFNNIFLYSKFIKYIFFINFTKRCICNTV